MKTKQVFANPLPPSWTKTQQSFANPLPPFWTKIQQTQETAFHDELVQLLALGYDLNFCDMYHDHETRSAYFLHANQSPAWIGRLTSDINSLPARFDALPYRLLDDVQYYAFSFEQLAKSSRGWKQAELITHYGRLTHRVTGERRYVAFSMASPYCFMA